MTIYCYTETQLKTTLIHRRKETDMIDHKPLIYTLSGRSVRNLLPLSRCVSAGRSRKHPYKIKHFNGNTYALHRFLFVVEAQIPLPSWYDVHHVNNNSLDNSPDNLIAIPSFLHKGLHHGTYRLTNGIVYKFCIRCRKWKNIEHSFHRYYKLAPLVVAIRQMCKKCHNKTCRERERRRKRERALRA